MEEDGAVADARVRPSRVGSRRRVVGPRAHEGSPSSTRVGCSPTGRHPALDGGRDRGRRRSGRIGMGCGWTLAEVRPDRGALWPVTGGGPEATAGARERVPVPRGGGRGAVGDERDRGGAAGLPRGDRPTKVRRAAARTGGAPTEVRPAAPRARRRPTGVRPRRQSARGGRRGSDRRRLPRRRRATRGRWARRGACRFVTEARRAFRASSPAQARMLLRPPRRRRQALELRPHHSPWRAPRGGARLARHRRGRLSRPRPRVRRRGHDVPQSVHPRDLRPGHAGGGERELPRARPKS